MQCLHEGRSLFLSFVKSRLLWPWGGSVPGNYSGSFCHVALSSLQTLLCSTHSSSGIYHFWTCPPHSQWTAPASLSLRAFPGSQSSLCVQTRQAWSVGEISPPGSSPNQWLLRHGWQIPQFPPPWVGWLWGVCVLCCLPGLSSRIESQVSVVVPGCILYSVSPPHSPAGVFWGHFTNTCLH